MNKYIVWKSVGGDFIKADRVVETDDTVLFIKNPIRADEGEKTVASYEKKDIEGYSKVDE